MKDWMWIVWAVVLVVCVAVGMTYSFRDWSYCRSDAGAHDLRCAGAYRQ